MTVRVHWEASWEVKSRDTTKWNTPKRQVQAPPPRVDLAPTAADFPSVLLAVACLVAIVR